MNLIIASISPALIFMYLIYQRDKIKEPRNMLVKAFIGGVLAIIMTILIDLIWLPFGVGFVHSAFMDSFFNAYIVAGLTEEFSKFIILYWIVWKSDHFDQRYDGIIYAVFVSMGFALIENIGYVLPNGMSTAIVRSILSVPGHGFFAVIMGYYLSLAKFHPIAMRRNYLLKALFIPVFIHGTFDFCLMYTSHKNSDSILNVILMILFTIVVIQFWRLGIRKIKEHVKRDQEDGFLS